MTEKKDENSIPGTTLTGDQSGTDSAAFTLWKMDAEKMILDALRYLDRDITVQNVLWCNTHFDSFYVDFMDKLLAKIPNYPQAINIGQPGATTAHNAEAEKIRFTERGYSLPCWARYQAWCELVEKNRSRFTDEEFVLAQKLSKCLEVDREYLSKLLFAVFGVWS